VVESLEDEVGNLLHDASVRGAEELADLVKLVDGSNLVVVGGDAVHHPRAPVGLHRPPALIHGWRSRRGRAARAAGGKKEAWRIADRWKLLLVASGVRSGQFPKAKGRCSSKRKPIRLNFFLISVEKIGIPQ
jgi:hypothetical protein